MKAYLDVERPADADTDAIPDPQRPRRDQPLTAYGIDQVINGDRAREELVHAYCQELRHTCLTRLRETGMP